MQSEHESESRGEVKCKTSQTNRYHQTPHTRQAPRHDARVRRDRLATTATTRFTGSRPIRHLPAAFLQNYNLAVRAQSRSNQDFPVVSPVLSRILPGPVRESCLSLARSGGFQFGVHTKSDQPKYRRHKLGATSLRFCFAPPLAPKMAEAYGRSRNVLFIA